MHSHIMSAVEFSKDPALRSMEILALEDQVKDLRRRAYAARRDECRHHI